MKRTFITFSDGHFNDELTKRLKLSLKEFSNYDLVIYNKSDFNIKFDTSDPEFWKSGLGYIYKVLSCLKSLETYDEVVWIDTDCLVTNYIDKIWFESWRVNKYPLLPKYRFSMFGNNSSNIEMSMNLQVENVFNQHPEIETDRRFYSQACFMLFNKSCKSFYQEVVTYFENYNKLEFPYRIFQHGAFGDESIINYLLWKNNYTDNLGEIFLCSHHFHRQLSNFIINKNRENFNKCFSIEPEINNFENVLFLHGQKNTEICDFLLDHLVKYRKINNIINNPLRIVDEIPNSSTNLCEIMRKNGSDKSTKHKYTRIYNLLFENLKDEQIKIFELGLGTNNTNLASNMGTNGVPGASLRGWKEYFINGSIYGADIDKEILFNEERIQTFYCDQTDSESIIKMWSELDFEFDIIIDDGLHSYDANQNFLLNSLHKLKKGGYFIIEDLLPTTFDLFNNNIDKLISSEDFDYRIIEVQRIPTMDSNLLVIKKKN